MENFRKFTVQFRREKMAAGEKRFFFFTGTHNIETNVWDLKKRYTEYIWPLCVNAHKDCPYCLCDRGVIEH